MAINLSKNKTPHYVERKEEKNTARVVLSITITMLLVLIAITLLSLFSSCAPKYGCGHGAPKQSWDKMVRRINSY